MLKFTKTSLAALAIGAAIAIYSPSRGADYGYPNPPAMPGAEAPPVSQPTDAATRLRADRDSAQQRVTSIQTQMDRMRSDLESCRKRMERGRADLPAAKADVAAGGERAQEAATAVQQIEAGLQADEERERNLMTDLATATNDLARAQDDVDRIAASLASAERAQQAPPPVVEAPPASENPPAVVTTPPAVYTDPYIAPPPAYGVPADPIGPLDTAAWDTVVVVDPARCYHSGNWIWFGGDWCFRGGDGRYYRHHYSRDGYRSDFYRGDVLRGDVYRGGIDRRDYGHHDSYVGRDYREPYYRSTPPARVTSPYVPPVYGRVDSRPDSISRSHVYSSPPLSSREYRPSARSYDSGHRFESRTAPSHSYRPSSPSSHGSYSSRGGGALSSHGRR